MKLLIFNNSDMELPISSKDEGGWAEACSPGVSYSLDRDKSDVVTLGDNPSFVEDLKDTAQKVVALFERLATKWKTKENSISGETAKPMVNVTLTNQGEKGVRVILGDNTKDFQL